MAWYGMTRRFPASLLADRLVFAELVQHIQAIDKVSVGVQVIVLGFAFLVRLGSRSNRLLVIL